MKKLRRWSGGGPLMILLGSCVMAPAAHVSADPAPSARHSAPIPDVADPPLNTPPADRTSFTLNGPMTQGALIQGWAPAGTTSLTLDGKKIDLAPDGRFIIAFDRNAGPTALLVARRADGTEVRDLLNVSKRAWDIQYLDTLAKHSQPSAVFLKLRKPEIAQIVAARKQETGAQGWREPFMWPVTGRISGMFGNQRYYKGEPGSYHTGIDIAVPTGTPVLAPADGVVILAAQKPFTLEGNLLMIDHGMGLNSAFLHLSKIDVKLGQHVKRGQVIGEVGMTGRATGPHLHWGLKWNNARIDPYLVAGPMPTTN